MALCCRICVSVILSLSCLLSVCMISNAEKCERVGVCVCKFKNGSVVDLRRISPMGKPLFKDKSATGKFNDTATYSYNPCFNFKEGNGECEKGVAVCQKTGNEEYALGDASRSVFEYDEARDKLILLYSESRRRTNVTLICSRDAHTVRLDVLGETRPGLSMEYLMNLTTVCACPDGCIEEEENSGLSTGSVLVVLFFVFSAVYFFGGILYLKIVRGASGSEAIPNYDFWVDFPLLVRDGVVFLFNCCRAETTYERI